MPGAALVERVVYRCPDSAAVRVQLVGACCSPGQWRDLLLLPNAGTAAAFFTCVNLPVELLGFTHVPDGCFRTWPRPGDRASP